MTLGKKLSTIDLKSGLLGKKPNSLTIYDKGIILGYKTCEKVLSFAELTAIQSYNYFQPNPINWDFTISCQNGEKFTISIPFKDRPVATTCKAITLKKSCLIRFIS